MTPDMIILYVDNLPASVAFYKKLFKSEPGPGSDDFNMFVSPSGLMFGLWAKDSVVPAIANTAKPGSIEIALPVANNAEVDTTAAEWAQSGLTIAQEPVDMPFGRTFTALDPDGHRLRVYCSANR